MGQEDMTPPHAPPLGSQADRTAPAAVSLRLDVLQKRSDFLRASRGPRVAMPGFILQMRDRAPADTEPPRIGFTCSKKVGNAVARNRAKRRLREIARLNLAGRARSGTDYVLVGRAVTTSTLPFAQLQSDLQTALNKLHGKPA